jgi:hypothetical protein
MATGDDGVADTDNLAAEPFSYRATKAGAVQIAYHGKVVTTLRGRDAQRFLSRVDAASAREAQLAMAKATGHFKHGNEGVAKQRRQTHD